MVATAQISHEILINGGGGLSSLNPKLSAGKKTMGGGGEFGIGYTCVFIKMVGVHVGVDFAFYNAGAKLNGVEVVTNNLTDSEGDRFNMHSTLNSYKEKLNATFMNIPIMAQVQIGKKYKVYAMAGFKIGIPLSCKYKVSGATLTNEGYYPEYENGLKEPLFAGFGRFENIDSKGKLKLGASAALALEAGMKWKLGEMLAVYTGIYFDYGLNNIAKNSDFIDYTNSEPAKFTTRSAVPTLADKMNLMAVGVKVRFAIIK
jgi:hypothetical protein